LADRGGKGEKDNKVEAAGVERCLRELLEFLLPLAFSKRRNGFVAAIQGQKAGHTVLGSNKLARAPAQLSGFVPFLRKDGLASRLLFASGF
jgi:hypothetical protein